MHGLLDGHPVVSLTFDPTLSGVDKSLAFPLLISNATSYLLVQAEDQVNDTQPFDRAESDIRPRALPTFDTARLPTQSDQAVSEVWPWLAAATRPGTDRARSPPGRPGPT